MAHHNSPICLLQKTDKNLSNFNECKLGRRPFGIALDRLIQNISDPYVIAIDSSWGTGKSTFLRMWETRLKRKGAIIIAFNAWECDFESDPLSAFMGEIEKKVKKLEDSPLVQGPIRDKWDEAVKVGKKMWRHSIPLLANALTRGAFAQLPDGDDETALFSELDDIAGKISENMIRDYIGKKESLKDFKTKLADFALTISQKTNGRYPLVFIIDELDRCRPSFAISLLERIKHLFEVPNIVFVLALDFNALTSGISHTYGQKIGEEGYLTRFFDYRVNLPEPKYKLFAEYLFKEYHLESLMDRWESSGLRKTIATGGFYRLSEHWHLSLRQQTRAVSALSVALRTVPTQLNFHTNINPDARAFISFWIPYSLTLLKVYNEDLYNSVRSGTTIKDYENIRNLIEYIGSDRYDQSSDDAVATSFVCWDELADKLRMPESDYPSYSKGELPVNLSDPLSTQLCNKRRNQLRNCFRNCTKKTILKMFDYIDLMWPKEISPE